MCTAAGRCRRRCDDSSGLRLVGRAPAVLAVWPHGRAAVQTYRRAEPLCGRAPCCVAVAAQGAPVPQLRVRSPPRSPPVGEVIQESKDRRGLPCDERAELRDGRPKGCELHGNYYVGPPEAPSGFVFRPTNPDCAAESKADISMKFILANEQLKWNPGCAKHPEL